MKLEQKILEELAQATARSAIPTGELGLGHPRKTVEQCLLAMYGQRVLGTCRIIKGDVVVDVWWPAGAVRDERHYSRSKRKTK